MPFPRRSARTNIDSQASAAGGSTRPWRLPVLTIVCAGLVAAGCSSSSPSGSSGSSSSPSAAAPKGTASVAYASSLQFLNEKVAAPAFTKATGYKYTGRGDSSGALEADIAGGEISPNVFEAVGGDNITPLEPKFTKWYIPYRGHPDGGGLQPQEQVRQRLQGLRGRHEAAEEPVHAHADARLQARPDRPQHRPAGPRLHLHAGAGPDVLPPARPTRSARSSAPRTPARPTRRRSSPSPRWTRRSSPASWTPRARSSPRPSSCTCPTSSCPPPSTWATPRWRTSTPRPR